MRPAPCLLLVVWGVFSPPLEKAHASSVSGTFQNGQAEARTLGAEAGALLRSGTLPDLAGMKEAPPVITEDHLSPEAVSRSLQNSEAGQYVLEQEKRPDRKQVIIDPRHDPLMTASTEVIKDPLKVLNAEQTVMEEQGDGFSEHVCEEPSEPFELSCSESLAVTVKNPPYESHIVTASISCRPIWGHGGKDPDWNSQTPTIILWDQGPHKAGVYRLTNVDVWPARWSLSHDLNSLIQQAEPESVSSKLLSSTFFKEVQSTVFSRTRINQSSRFVYHPLYVPNGKGLHNFVTTKNYSGDYPTDTLRFEVILKKKTEITEAWQSGCAALAALSDDEGRAPCDLIEERCTEGPETRTINGVPVRRDCWKKTRIYLCGSPRPGTCGEFRIRGCTQTASDCVEKAGDRCLRFRQRYRCPEGPGKRTIRQIAGKEVPWCLDGNCHSPVWEANGDMLQAISRMAVLQQIQKDMKELAIFSGRDLRCRRSCAGFQNCCGTERGWGLDIRFASCSDEEKLLAGKQKNGLCVFLGTYCSKRVLGVCVQKKSTSCCYESKIARIIQQAAHSQLGLGWGSAEEPRCGALTPEQLASLDLEKVDFRELYEEIMARYRAPRVITPQTDTLKQTVKDVSRGEPVAAREGL